MPNKHKSGAGFTVIELLVSAVIIIILFSFVLANFHTARYSGEIDVVLKQIISGVSTIRNYSIGGQLINGSFPGGGYGINFDLKNPSQFVLYAADFPDTSLAAGEVLANGVGRFTDIKFIELCGLDATEVTSLPCQEGTWEDLGDFLEIIFSLSNGISFNYEGEDAGYKFAGGIIEHQKTGLQSYFYVSLVSGLISGGLVP
ncbi:type II secretion system protein [Candidatus Falkowbacteria bacterium]|nr:type II secretion system protein [Candidatus Falkowbacteria bacterium]